MIVAQNHASSSRTRVFPGKCTVCGAPARCLHYDALTCNGCKTFFRRSLVDRKRYVCAKNGKCEINEGNRMFCKSCRLAKCFACGMNANAIQIEDKEVRKQMCVQLQRRGTVVDYRGRCEQIVPPNVFILESTCNKLVDSLIYFENRLDRVRLSTFDPAREGLHHKDIEYFLTTSFCFGDINKLEKPTNWPITTAIPRSFEDYALNFSYCKHWFLLDLLLVVEFAKTLGGFQIIPVHEQKEILKTAMVTNRLFVEAFFSFQVKSDSIVFPDGVKPLSMVQAESTDIYVQCFKGVMEPLIRYKPSRQEYVLCKAIITLSAECRNISHETAEILDTARKQYTDILLKICQRDYGELEGAVRFGNLMGLIQAMHSFGEKFDRLRTLYLMKTRISLPGRTESKLSVSLFNNT